VSTQIAAAHARPCQTRHSAGATTYPHYSAPRPGLMFFNCGITRPLTSKVQMQKTPKTKNAMPYDQFLLDTNRLASSLPSSPTSCRSRRAARDLVRREDVVRRSTRAGSRASKSAGKLRPAKVAAVVPERWLEYTHIRHETTRGHGVVKNGNRRSPYQITSSRASSLPTFLYSL
jgi:hypothetical protein